MDRINGQGFHPTVRPFHPHRKKERNKIKVFRKATPQAWQLAMMRLGMGFVTNEEDRVELGKLIESGAFDLEGTTLLAPMCGGEISCGSAGDYSITQADPSRPPPKQDVLGEENEFVSCEQKIENITATSCNHRKTHRLQKYLFRVLFMTLPFMATAIMSTACHKEPYDVIIDWDWDKDIGLAPSKEVIKKEINKKNVNMVFINLGKQNVTGLPPIALHMARDTLESRTNLAPGHIRLMGTIYVHSVLPDVNIDTIAGIGAPDSTWFAQNGLSVQYWRPGLTK